MEVYETKIPIDKVNQKLFDASKQSTDSGYRQVEFITASRIPKNPEQIYNAIYRVGPSCAMIYQFISRPGLENSRATRINLSAGEDCYKREALDILEGLLRDLTPVPPGLTIKQELEQLARSLR